MRRRISPPRLLDPGISTRKTLAKGRGIHEEDCKGRSHAAEKDKDRAGLSWNGIEYRPRSLSARRTHHPGERTWERLGLGERVGVGQSHTHTCGDGGEQRVGEVMLRHREMHKDVHALDPLLAVLLDVRPRQLLRVPGKTTTRVQASERVSSAYRQTQGGWGDVTPNVFTWSSRIRAYDEGEQWQMAEAAALHSLSHRREFHSPPS